MILTRVLGVLLKVLFAARQGDSKYALARTCLISKMTYRLPENAKNDRLIGLRVLARLFKTIYSGQTAVKPLETTSDNLILTGTFKFLELIPGYLRRLGVNTGCFAARQHLPVECRKDLPALLVFVLLGSIMAARTFFISRCRVHYALIVRELAESYALVKVLRRMGATAVYDFAPFEKDSNFLYLVLNDLNYRHNKLVSPGPLGLHNRILLADMLYYNTPYQEEEIEFFRDTLRVGERKKWPPEYAFNYIDKYIGLKDKQASNGIGFYSHAGWLREEEGHAKDGMQLEQAEYELLRILGNMQEFKNKELTVFCHPKEKKSRSVLVIREYYGRYLEEGTFRLADFEMATAMNFEQVDMGVCAYSAIMFERLFCGYKTFIYIPDNGNNPARFPLENSNIRNICFRNEEELYKLIDMNQNVAREEFFINNQLRGYPYWDFDQFVL